MGRTVTYNKEEGKKVISKYFNILEVHGNHISHRDLCKYMSDREVDILDVELRDLYVRSMSK